MMQPLTHAPAIEGEPFAQGLLRALRSVVAVDIDGQMSCTGWMVTPSVVALPAYALRHSGNPQGRFERATVRARGESFEAWIDEAEGPAQVDYLSAGGTGQQLPDQDIALMRLRGKHEVPALAFALRPPALLEPLVLLHFGQEAAQAQLVFGTFDTAGPEIMRYQAPSVPGSGGAPVFDTAWRVIGMHFFAGKEGAYGLGRAAVNEMLQRSRWWKEIAQHQGLADVVAGREATPSAAAKPPADLALPALIRAALSFAIQPDALSPADREALAGHVVNARASSWTMRPAARQAVLRAAGPLEALVPYLPKADPAPGPGPGVVEQILRGPPYRLDNATEDELARWLQAVRWFAGIAPELPSAARVNQLLQQRRARGRLANIAGSDFTGRKEELRRMKAWFESRSPAPLNVWGVGGVGKSALVARFVQTLPESVVILWLDFDRADIAPDDAPSIVAALLEQTVPQVVADGEPAAGADARQDLDTARNDLIRLLARGGRARRPLVVLDSFEAAQYSERYQELWPELERLCADVPNLQVIVSGRAPLRTLQLRGHAVEEIALRGLEAADARTWLARHGIADARIQDEVVQASGGLPLVLKLAERLVRAGGKAADLPAELPGEMIAGVLYDRILDRVHDPVFKEIAKGAVVLRRLTVDMMAPLFEGLVQLPPGEPAAWFRELSREAALVEGTDELRLRPEVRGAALALLERHEADFVKAIDRRAIDWYERQDANNPAIAAELVYHCLRVGDLPGAEAAWRDGCATHLQYAEETLRDAARDWLAQRVGTAASVQGSDIRLWEAEAADRVKGARARGKGHQVKEIFAERRERSGAGALAFHEAYEMRRGDDHAGALRLLRDAGFEGEDAVARERAMLAALLSTELDDRHGALRILSAWRHPQRWRDRRDGAVERAALDAARVCLSLPLADEKEIADLLAREPRIGRLPVSAAEWVAPMDFMLDGARRRSQRGQPKASLHTLRLPDSPQEGERFLQDLDHFRRLNLGDAEPRALQDLRARIFGEEVPGEVRSLPGFLDVQTRMLVASWRRWRVLSEGAMVATLREALAAKALTPLEESVVTALSLFTGTPGLVLHVPVNRRLSLEDAIEAMEKRFTLRSSVQAYNENLFDFGRALRKRALRWSEGKPRPLELLVSRFARGFEEE